MALSGTGGIKHLARTASFTETGNWTWVFWAKIPSGAGAGVYFPLRGFGDVSYTNPYILVFIAEFNHVTLELFYGGVFHDSTFVDVDDQWHGYAVTYDATSHVMTLYTGESALTTVGTLTKDMSTMAFVETDEFSSGDTTTNSGSAQEYDRVFSAKLTPTQILAELASIDAVITASLEADTRIAAQGNLTDSSGNGNDWTATGTFAYLSGPLPPVNITPATATVISSLPYTLASLDVQDAPTGSVETAPTCAATRGNEVWFAYTTTTTDVLLSVTGDAVLGTGSYVPKFSVWTGTPGALVQLTFTGNNLCDALNGNYFNVPVDPSTLYYIRVDYNSTTQPLDDTLTLAVDTAPTTTPVVGDILIPDDETGFPALLISPTTSQTLLSAFPFPAGEFDGVLPDGSHCVVEEGDQVVSVFDAAFNLVGTMDYSPAFVFAIVSNFVDTFYIAVRVGTAATVVHTLDASGNAGATTWTLGDTSHHLFAMAPNRNGSKLYYTTASVTPTAVYAYDLTNSLDLPDLHAGFGSEIAQGRGCGFVTPSGTIWLGFSLAGGVSGVLREFDSAGNVLQTWSVVDATYTRLNKFALHPDETSVVVWDYNEGPTSSRFQRLQLSDQTVLDSVTFLTNTISGGPTASQWTISDSCPIMLIWAIGGMTTSTDPIRRLRRFEIAYDRHLTQFLRRIEFYCQPGTGLVTGQGSDPTLMFRLSKDGGITWSTEQTMSIGAMGDYTARAYLIGLGSGRHLVGEISCSDPTTFALIDCIADLDGGTS